MHFLQWEVLQIDTQIDPTNTFCTYTHLVVLYLHGADAQTPVDDELTERRRPFVAVATVDHEQTAQMLELSHREVGSQRGLLSFLSNTQHRGQ